MMDDQINQSEAETIWIEQARQGNKRAFSRLVEAYQRPVYSITYRMLGNPEEAEDAAQETFLKAFSNLRKYDPDRKFSTWLFSIANHHCIDRLRKRRVKWVSIDDNPVLGNMEGDSPRPETQALGQEQRDSIQHVIEQLEPGYRMPLVLRYWEECSYEEIAEIMEISIPAVKSRLFRARQQVAQLYRENEQTAWPSHPEADVQRQHAQSASEVESRQIFQYVSRGGLAMAAGLG